MLSENLRKRIAALNRGDLQHTSSPPDDPASGEDPPAAEKPRRRPQGKRTGVPEKILPAAQPPPAHEMRLVASASDARLRLSLDDVVAGEEIETDAGSFLLIDRSYQELFPGGGSAFGKHYAGLISSLEDDVVPEDRYDTFRPLAAAKPEDLLYVDIEATGFTSGTPLFLVGALSFFSGDLRVRQLLARDYTEEAGLLSCFSPMLDAADVVISFNGKTYDLPYIRDRSLFMGVPFDLRQIHIDMLHVARRRWGKRLPNCKLQTLEQYICRRMRQGDIPGSEIPDAYHRFVQSGNAVQMRDILHHNALDLITMAEVMAFILEGREL